MKKYESERRAAAAATPNQISAVEAVGYTLLIAFIAVVASGKFDIMIPWNS